MEIGEIVNGLEVLPKDQRKTILLLSDDLRMHSGIATMSREFVLGLCHHFNFIQVGAAINHPDAGKVFDLAPSIEKEVGAPDPSVRIYANSGYGEPGLIRQLLQFEHVDAIMHFTDPRYWIWLYQMEHELRRKIPIIFYTIWDNLPDPKYNKTYYESCDSLLCISKQTYGLVKRLTADIKEDWQVQYVPHGINPKFYHPMDKSTDEFQAYVKSVFGEAPPKFMVGFNSRNIGRKNVMDVVWAFDKLAQKVGKENVGLVLHTQPVDPNGTDLLKYITHNYTDLNIFFSGGHITTDELNRFYNACDVVVSMSSNEGFGLSTAEAVMAGTPIVVNVTGGVQDQCGFEEEGEYLRAEDYVELGTLSIVEEEARGNYSWGEWAFPVWPKATNFKGSVPTPYIWDDQPDVQGVADALEQLYNMSADERDARGLKGREEFLNQLDLSTEGMCSTMGKGINECLENFVERKRFEIFEV